MKRYAKTIIAFLGLFAFSCENSPTKKPVVKIDSVIKKTLIIKQVQLLQIPKKPIQTRLKVVKSILKTSVRYSQITKGLNRAVIENGGQGFGICLERSPNPKKDGAMGFSKTYDFVVYEMYPERQLNIAWFSFNPRNNKLYEYDPILDHQKQIVFDKNLLEKLRE